MEKCSDTIEQFGGHKYAAGLTLLPENYKEFKQKFEQVVKESIPKELLSREIKIDQEIMLSDITPKLYRILNQFGPFGPKNMKPVFLVKDVFDTGYARPVGSDESHLKLKITDGTYRFDAIGFGLGNRYTDIKDKKAFDCVFTIEENVWNGTKTLQLNLKDIKIGNHYFN